MPPFDKAKYSQPLDILKGKNLKRKSICGKDEKKKKTESKNLCHVPVSRRIRERLCVGDTRLSSVVQIR